MNQINHRNMAKEDRRLVTFAIKDNSKTPQLISWNEAIQIADKCILFKVDTGSDVNLLPYEIFKKLKPKPKLVTSTAKLSSYTGHVINILGSSDVTCGKNGKQQIVKFFITGLNSESVLGLQACIDFGLVTKISTPIEVYSAEKTIKLYSDVFGPPETMRCTAYHINLAPNAKPSQTVCKKITLPLKAKLEAELHKLVEYGLMEPVSAPSSAWTHPIILSIKGNDVIKIYMDCRPLNKHIIPEHYLLPSIEEILTNTKSSQYFSILTAPQGFTQLPLDDQSSNLCIIATPCGNYKFKTIPYGISKASAIFHNIATQMFDGIEGVVVYVDDIMIHGKTKDEHNGRLIQVLERARKYNLKFSKIKLQLVKSELAFLGHTVSKNGITIDQSRVEAVKYLAEPTNKQELQRFMNMVHYLGQSIPNLSLHCDALNKLLDKSEKFFWKREQDTAFNALKTSICEPPTLRNFNSHKTLYISVAASSYGLGAVALQDCQPVGYYSTTLTSAQQKFSQIDKKLLAILSGLEKFYFCTYAREVIVQSDHRPLLAAVKDPMDMMSARTQNILLKLMKFHFKLDYVAGKDLAVAYVLSRSPLKQEVLQDIKVKPSPPRNLLCATEERICDFKQSLKEDTILQQVISYVKDGWPKYPSWVKTEARKYFNIKEELCYTGELLFSENRLVVPENEKENVLKQLHTAAHQNIKSCQQKAKMVYYWPTMEKDIETYIANCLECQRSSKLIANNPVICHDLPELPWNKLGIAFIHVDRKNYLIIVDYFSKFLLIKQVNIKTAKSAIGILEDAFSVHGLPLEIVSPNTPPFNTSEWKLYLKTYDMKHSSCIEPGDNETIEKHIQIAKSLIKKSQMGLFLAILEYNSTPLPSLPSPSELLMGRRLRTSLLIPKAMLIPNYDISKAVVTMKVLHKEIK